MNRIEDISYEIWATAQTMPWEGVTDGAKRIQAILEEKFELKQSNFCKCGQVKHVECIDAETHHKCIYCLRWVPNDDKRGYIYVSLNLLADYNE